jgi:hypothetical protein
MISCSSKLGEGERLPIVAASGTPFVQFITNPTPLVYAILCEQADIVLHLILRVRAKLDVAIVPLQFSMFLSCLWVFFNAFLVPNSLRRLNC